MSKPKKTRLFIGHAEVKFESEIHFHEILDTKVLIGDQLLCTIAGSDIHAFIKDLQRLVDLYSV